MFEEHLTTRQKHHGFQKSARRKPHASKIDGYTTITVVQQTSSIIPLWLKRLITRRTRMIEPYRLSGKDGSW